ncbi:MAG: DUF3035 domain-containing protein [Magnetococcus sp. YQC-3]
MKQTLFRLCATLTLLLGGCSGNLTLPWESNLLDPSRIATREPLEIPPDLNALPPTEGAADRNTPRKITWTDPSAAPKPTGKAGDKSAGNSNSTIRLPIQNPENKDDASLSRTEQEKLPAWMEKDNKGRAPKTGK